MEKNFKQGLYMANVTNDSPFISSLAFKLNSAAQEIYTSIWNNRAVTNLSRYMNQDPRIALGALVGANIVIIPLANSISNLIASRLKRAIENRHYKRNVQGALKGVSIAVLTFLGNTLFLSVTQYQLSRIFLIGLPFFVGVSKFILSPAEASINKKKNSESDNQPKLNENKNENPLQKQEGLKTGQEKQSKAKEEGETDLEKKSKAENKATAQDLEKIAQEKAAKDAAKLAEEKAAQDAAKLAQEKADKEAAERRAQEETAQEAARLAQIEADKQKAAELAEEQEKAARDAARLEQEELDHQKIAESAKQNKDGVKIYKLNMRDPPWREMIQGINLKAVCTKYSCDAARTTFVWIKEGLGTKDIKEILKQRTLCPKCNNKTEKPTEIGFWDCKFTLIGEKQNYVFKNEKVTYEETVKGFKLFMLKDKWKNLQITAEPNKPTA